MLYTFTFTQQHTHIYRISTYLHNDRPSGEISLSRQVCPVLELQRTVRVSSCRMRVAVVTGANRGIGLAVVRRLCKEFQGEVYLTSR